MIKKTLKPLLLNFHFNIFKGMDINVYINFNVDIVCITLTILHINYISQCSFLENRYFSNNFFTVLSI